MTAHRDFPNNTCPARVDDDLSDRLVPVPGAVLDSTGQVTLVVRGNEDDHVRHAGARRLYSQTNCWCVSCDLAQNNPLGRTRMCVCPECGDKRCPRAAHHDAPCPSPAEQKLKTAAHAALDAAERSWHAYAASCEVGPERIRAFEIFENVRRARCVGTT